MGFTRGTIVRTIIAEGLLIGIVAGLPSVLFGIVAGWCGCGFAQSISFFGGLHPDLVVPWASLLLGLSVLLRLAGATTVWPATDIGRTRPLTLLQRGRGTF